MSKHTPKAKPRSGKARFPGIVEDAQALGVTRTHLFLVLTGKRPSARLKAAYEKLQKSAA